MRWRVSMAAAMSAMCVCAFSSAKWMAERGDDSDMLRLRAAYAECAKKIAENQEAPAENVSIPVESFPDGTVKSRVTAAKAHIFADSSFVWGEKIRFEQNKEDGSAHLSIEAENCIFDRTTKTGWVAGAAKISYGDAVASGRGVYFSVPREFVKIFSQSEIRAHSKGRFDPGSLLK